MVHIKTTELLRDMHDARRRNFPHCSILLVYIPPTDKNRPVLCVAVAHDLKAVAMETHHASSKLF
jgi:hypothetical protein